MTDHIPPVSTGPREQTCREGFNIKFHEQDKAMGLRYTPESRRRSTMKWLISKEIFQRGLTLRRHSPVVNKYRDKAEVLRAITAHNIRTVAEKAFQEWSTNR